MKELFFVLTLTFLCFIIKPVYAQEDSLQTEKSLFDMSLEELMNVRVVTASKVSEKASTAPATVYVVTRQQIDGRNYSCLRDLLEDIPQVEVQRNAGTSLGDIYTMNGMTGNEKFVLLMDGVRINSITGTRYAMRDAYSLANVKQVEVILGPASSLYGADAVTGIINIITYRGNENTGVHFSSSYGRFNTTENNLIINGGNEKVAYSVVGKYYFSEEAFLPDLYTEEYAWYDYYQQTGNMGLFGDTVNIGSPKPWNMASESYTLRARINVKNFEFGYSRMQDQFSSSLGQNPKNYLYNEETVYANQVQNLYGTHLFKGVNEKWQLQSSLAVQEFKTKPHSKFINQYSSFGPAYKYERNRALKLDEQLSYSLSERLSLLGGLNYQYLEAIPRTSDLPYEYDESIAPEDQQIPFPGTQVTDSAGNDLTLYQDIYHIKYHTLGAYLQLQANLAKHLNLTIGSRYDYSTLFQSTFNPRVGLVYSQGRFTLKLLYGTSFLAPSPYQTNSYYGSFYPVYNEQGQVTALGSEYWYLTNTNLKPLRRVSYDFATSFRITPDFILSFNGYYGTVSNLITTEGFTDETFQGVPVDFVERPVNRGQSITYGGTFRLDFKGQLAYFLRLNAFTAYSFSDGEIENMPLIYTSQHTVKAGFNFIVRDDFNIFTRIEHRSGSSREGATNENLLRSPAFTVISTTANFRALNKEKYSLSVFGSVTNLTNARFYHAGSETFNFAPQDPIRMEGGVKLHIK